jgi:hypothetical protein
MAKREKLERLTSPAGIAQYPRLNKPDEYKGKKSYKSNLILDPEDEGVQEFLDRVKDVAEASMASAVAELKKGDGKKKAKAKKVELFLPYEPEYDDNGDETGKVIVKARKNAEFEKDGEVVQTKVHIFDSNGVIVKKPPIVWGGSTLKLAVDLFPFYNPSADQAGVSLRLQGAQIIELVTGGSASAASMGFGSVEGGYAAATDLEDEAADDADDGGDEDF